MPTSGEVRERRARRKVPGQGSFDDVGTPLIDVTTTSTVKAFHHYSVGGELTVEEPEVLTQVIDDVVCRWCNSGDGVEELPADD